MLAILYLLLVIGCPPSTPNKDAFGPGPDRDMTTDTTDDGADTTAPPADTTDGSAVDGDAVDGTTEDGDTGDGDGDVTPPDEPAAPDGGGGE